MKALMYRKPYVKYIVLGLFALIIQSGCTKNQAASVDLKENSLEIRSNPNELVFGDGISRTAYYNEETGEYEYTISADFEIRPYGESNWYPYMANKKIRVKCRCQSSCPGINECTAIVDSESATTITCDNECGSPYWSCSCKMRIRITSLTDDSSITEYEGGAEVELL